MSFFNQIGNSMKFSQQAVKRMMQQADNGRVQQVQGKDGSDAVQQRLGQSQGQSQPVPQNPLDPQDTFTPTPPQEFTMPSIMSGPPRGFGMPSIMSGPPKEFVMPSIGPNSLRP